MISFQKYTHKKTYLQIAHVERSLSSHNTPGNRELIRDDFFLSPDRGMSGYHYYKEILSRCYVYGRANVKTLVGITVTLPNNVPESCEMAFWSTTYDFLNDRYAGEQYVVSCAVHKDKAEQPHMHYLFCPIVPNTNPKHAQEVKICCTELLPPLDYKTILDDFHNYLDKASRPEGTEQQYQMQGVQK